MILTIHVLMSLAFAAPHPATSSSLLIASHKNIVHSAGFVISPGRSAWIQDEEFRSKNNVSALFRAPQLTAGDQASLSVRSELLPQKRQFKSEVKQWIRDFRRLGFEVMTSKNLTIAGQNAYLLDLLHAESQKQLRQVVFIKDQRLVVLTCRDHRDYFQESVKNCNEITKTFRWL